MNEVGESTPQSATEDLVLKWWRNLEIDRRSRSALRRASSIDDVITERGFYDILSALRELNGRTSITSLACATGVLAHVSCDESSASLGKQLADHFSKGNSGDLRFRRLLGVESSERDRLMTEMVRVVRLMRGTTNVIDLFNKTYWWNERARRDLAYDFYTNFRD